ncbi:hypothetical protein BTHE_1844 [Bifidobacterium thermophilum]|nr:hypothetical protein BTHE_1844 [Bifidobacterium thermophilum]
MGGGTCLITQLICPLITFPRQSIGSVYVSVGLQSPQFACLLAGLKSSLLVAEFSARSIVI